MKKEKQGFYSIPEAARTCGVSRATMWNWVKSGKVAAFVTPGGHHRIRRQEMERLISDGRCGGPASPAAKRLLIVDDDPHVRKMFEVRLGQAGYEVLSAANGFEAGEMVYRHWPDLVLLDLFMEGLDGFQVCRKIKADAEGREIKVLAISGHKDADLEARILGEGADAFLTKSAGVDAVMAVIESLLASP